MKMTTNEKFHPYQNFCVDYLVSHSRCGLFLDMGLGKTSITLKAIDILMNDYLEIRKVLVIAPLRVAKMTWKDEVSKWEDFKDLTIQEAIGTSEERIKAINSKAEIVTINRENIKWLYDYYISNKKRPPFDMIVIDESSSFKNRSTARWKACKAFTNIAKRVVILTGTPTPNGYMDLWSQIYLLDKGQRLGLTLTEYRNRYFYLQNLRFHQYKLRTGAEMEINDSIKDICVSMNSKDYLTLPEKIVNNIPIQLGESELRLYKTMEKDMLIELDGEEITAANAAVVMNKLIQLASGAIYDEKGDYKVIHSAKIEALKEIIEDNEGKPILVFYNFKNEKERIMEAFKELEPRELNTEKDQKDWNEGKIRLLVINPASAGHGLNLQAGGNIIVWFSLTWNLEYYQQANKRLYRQGQKNSVVINHLIAKGTVDEDVLSRLQGKGKVQDNLLAYIKAKVSEK